MLDIRIIPIATSNEAVAYQNSLIVGKVLLIELSARVLYEDMSINVLSILNRLMQKLGLWVPPMNERQPLLARVIQNVRNIVEGACLINNVA
jgi:hypothetical protein